MPPLRNEVEVTDKTDHAAGIPMGFVVALIGGLHVICCGLPLLLFSGVSLATIFPSWAVIGVGLALLGIVGFTLHFRRGCVTCPRQPQAPRGGAA